MLGLIGIKLGMTQVYNKDGLPVPVTVVELPRATVMEVLTTAKNGYVAIKLASGTRKEKHLTKPEIGQFKKASVALSRFVAEFRLKDATGFEVGKVLDVSLFEGSKVVTVTGTSKGRGFAGTIKRHGFSRGPETHGSQNVRAPGSLGAHTYPGRVWPGQKLGGHMGVQAHTYKNLELVQVDVERNLLFIKGAIPGANQGKVIVRKPTHV
jgi:large subunit ribosomal protein L3